VHVSIQRDHLHLVVEAHDERALSSGARGLSIRAARALNGLLGRTGRLWGDRYHARPLTTPREVRNGLVYVLMNSKKHLGVRTRRIDGCSSAAWFDGFVDPLPRSADSPPVCAPRTWLARVGWRRHGLIRRDEIPAIAQPRVDH
jgi:hypothetical protein